MKYESVLLLDARCLISWSIAHLQHELPRNPYNPPMDKIRWTDRTLMQRLWIVLTVVENLEVLQQKHYL